MAFATPTYYFGFSSHLKNVIDRFYAVNGKIKGASKNGLMLMAYADTARPETEPMLLHYKPLMNYLGWKEKGTVVAPWNLD